MRFAVVSTTAEHGEMAAHLLPPTPRVAHGADRIYFFYQMAGGHDFSFTDFHGQLLIEVHNFQSLAEADAWAAEDARQRRALLSADGGTH